MTHRTRGALFAATLLFFFTLSVCIGIFAHGRNFAAVDISKRYFFLVRDCESATAGAVAGESYYAGGAGYLMDEGTSVVLAGYYSKSDATVVGGTMSERGVKVRVLEREISTFGVNGDAAEFAVRIESCADVLDTLSRMLFDAANGLERNTATQEEARAAVLGVAKSLAGLKTDGEVFSLLDPELSRMQRRAKELAAGILFANDLRYLQVRMLFTILNFDQYFA